MLYRVIPAGDLDIVDGDLVLLDGIDWFRQALSCRFKFFLGEWFLDLREGIPYYRHVFVANPDLDVIRSIFRQVALSMTRASGAPVVRELPRFDVIYTPSTRSLEFDFQAVLDTGDVVNVMPGDAPFVITVQRQAA